MTEPGRGLRFDIYERIHLAEDSIGINELHEVELIPHIQVIAQDEQALLRGNLLLTGQYIGEDAEDKRTLEHLIPVEITLPMSRINRIEDILVEIENFDVELMSMRNLNVTGVLSLHGIELSSEPSQAANAAGLGDVDTLAASANIASFDSGETLALNEPWLTEEEMTFTHHQPLAARTELESFMPKPSVYEEAKESSPVEKTGWGEKAYISQLSEHPEPIEPAFEPPTLTSPYADQLPYYAPVNPYADLRQNYEPDLQPPIPSSYEEPARYEQPPSPMLQQPSYEVQPPLSTSYFASSDYFTDSDAQQEEELNEVRVAVTSRKTYEPVASEQNYGIKSLLRSSAAQEGQQLAAAAEEAARKESSRLDALEWRKLFLRESSEQQEFRKVKMVIVQKEDSLDEIARRYGVQYRELQQHNRLATDVVQAGQILYIPK